MDLDEYVQPIVLLRQGTHEDAVLAVAKASVRAWLDHPDEPGWQPWLSAAFVKTVRRAKPAQFEALRGGAAGPVLADVHVGDAAALAYAPVRYAELPKAIGKLQVSGTDLPRAGWQPNDTRAQYLLIVNDELGMSSGKTAAQAAHALFALALTRAELVLAVWTLAEDGMDVHVTGVDADTFVALTPMARVTITDAGRTEVDPRTATVLAVLSDEAEEALTNPRRVVRCGEETPKE